jgi:hypothetical protein
MMGGALVATLLLVGCGDRGPKLVDAGGKVTYQGKPVPNAHLTFVHDGDAPTGMATTDEQGNFKATSEGRPGLVVGSYKVAITAAREKRPVTPEEAVTMTAEQTAANTEYLIPQTYGNLVTSGLTATVTDDPAQNNFTFDLK